jgi:hypothetical protein
MLYFFLIATASASTTGHMVGNCRWIDTGIELMFCNREGLVTLRGAMDSWPSINIDYINHKRIPFSVPKEEPVSRKHIYADIEAWNSQHSKPLPVRAVFIPQESKAFVAYDEQNIQAELKFKCLAREYYIAQFKIEKNCPNSGKAQAFQDVDIPADILAAA